MSSARRQYPLNFFDTLSTLADGEPVLAWAAARRCSSPSTATLLGLAVSLDQA